MTPSPLPRIVILADRNGHDLLPLTRETPVALLGVATRTLLDLCIDSLLPLAPTDIDVVVCAHSDRIRQHIERTRGGQVSATYVLSQGEEAPRKVLHRAGRLLASDYLVLRADMLRTGDLAAFVSAARHLQAGCVSAVVGGEPAGLWYCASENDLDAIPGWPLDFKAMATLQLDNGHSDPLTDLRAFHRSNLQALAGHISALELPGRSAGNGLIVGRNARCAVRPESNAQVLLGQGAQVFAGVSLRGKVLIADHAIVDRDSLIEDSVILPHSYIGPGVELRQAIVSGNSLIRADSGAELTVVDAFLLADLKHAELPARIAAPLHSLAGVILLVLSAPLWPLAAFMAWREHPNQPIVQHEFLGSPAAAMAAAIQRQSYVGWRWNTSIPILRALPQLLALVRGQLRLFGTAPLSPAEANGRDADWQHLTDKAPPGLIGPTQLVLRPDDPLEERLLSDAFYVRQRNLRVDLSLLLRAGISLFGPRAWRRGAQP